MLAQALRTLLWPWGVPGKKRGDLASGGMLQLFRGCNRYIFTGLCILRAHRRRLLRLRLMLFRRTSQFLPPARSACDDA